MNRSIRRHHRYRIYRKRIAQNVAHAGEFTERSWIEWNARKRINTGRPCSCRLCKSSRKLYGNAKFARTFAEQRCLDSMYDQLADL